MPRNDPAALASDSHSAHGAPIAVAGRDAWSPWSLVAGALILAIAAVIRFRTAGQTRLWYDEIYTLWMARLPLPDLLRTVAADVHPPLHVLLVHAWRAIGGEGEVWIRSLSIVFGVATIAAVIGLGRRMFGTPAGLLAGALLTLHRTHTYFSTESRPYALLWLWLVLAMWCAWNWIEGARKRDALLFVACAAGALYTHYLAGVVLGAVALWGALLVMREPRRLAHWIGWLALVAICFAPQFPTLLAQAQRNTAEHWIQAPSVDALVNLLRQISVGMTTLIPVVAVFAIVPFFVSRTHRPASLLWAVVVLPIAACWLLTQRGLHLYTERYMFYAVPFVCLLVAAGVAGVRPPGSPRPQDDTPPAPHWISAVCAIGLLFAAAKSLAVSHPLPEAVEQARALELLRARATDDQTILAADTHSLLFLRQHWPQHERTRLLWRGRIPYYDAALVIPESWVVGPETLDSLATAGPPWWAMHTRNSGTDVSAMLEHVEARAERVASEGLVRVWAGRVLLGASVAEQDSAARE